VKLHVLVDELETARIAVEGGATVVQWRLKEMSRVDVVERGRTTRSLCARHGVPFVVNDDVEAALMLGADGVHLGRDDQGAETAKSHGLLLGLSATSVDEARAADGVADYIGAGPVSTPVVAIGGIEIDNAGDCIRAGAAGVAVIRAAREAAALVRAIDAAL
jgi:thiamine-phosphate pyrophosphorylase